MSKAFDTYLDTQVGTFEGVETLEQLVTALGYESGWGRGRALEAFFDDNSGAIEAVFNWVAERMERSNDEWDSNITEYLAQEGVGVEDDEY